MVSILLVIYKSKRKLLNSFIRGINGKFNLIIIDNSGNYDFSKIALPKKTKIIKSSNKGYGAALNLGLKYCKTKYAIISNIDVIFKKNFVLDFLLIAKRVKKFAILIPNHKNKNYRSELIENYEGEAATMLVNVKKINKLKFDENFFLYYEETDLFLKCKKNNYKVFIINNLKIKHKRSSSISYKNNNLQFFMKWHFMWSMFYFYRKNYNFLYALKKTYLLICKDLIKLIFYIITFDKIGFKVRFYRLHGIACAIIGLKAYKRP